MSDIDTLRSHLFNTLQALQDKNNPMEVERARAINETAQVIINCAKAETDFLRVNGSVDTKFFNKPALPAPASGGALPKPSVSSTEEEEQEDVPAFGSHETQNGSVTVDHRNGQRIVTHRIR